MKILGIGSRCTHSGHALTVEAIEKELVYFRVDSGQHVHMELGAVESALADKTLTVEQV